MTLLPILYGCSPSIYQLTTHFREDAIPPEPDYSSESSWAALPFRRDAADSVPLKSGFKDAQATADADVFFIYPTIFTQKPLDDHHWNAAADDPVLNRQIQTTTILNQATIFNGAARVYSPYYRQAHYHVFVTTDRNDAERALDLAYSDVRRAFQYYLTRYNSGRPIIIASHSQGSLHAERLLLEFFDGKPLQRQLVAAYIPGRAVPVNRFTSIPPTSSPEQTGVWAAWCTFTKGYWPATYDKFYKGALATNPLLWSSSPEYAPKELNTGGVGFKYTFFPTLADAQSKDGILWTNIPYVRGRFWVRTKNWHRADMNLFYNNIRENAILRVSKFQEQATGRR
ncbi:MAG: DUF3089 domain-containing protein [Bacteroidota bacterium]